MSIAGGRRPLSERFDLRFSARGSKLKVEADDRRSNEEEEGAKLCASVGGGSGTGDGPTGLTDASKTSSSE